MPAAAALDDHDEGKNNVQRLSPMGCGTKMEAILIGEKIRRLTHNISQYNLYNTMSYYPRVVSTDKVLDHTSVV